MTQEDFNFARTYASMEDEELLELARDARTLVDSAQTALQREMNKRGLKLGPPPAHGDEDPSSGFFCTSCERAVTDPLNCGECSTTICRVCGTPLRISEDLGSMSDEEEGAPDVSGARPGNGPNQGEA
jgi:hypothetical protein